MRGFRITGSLFCLGTIAFVWGTPYSASALSSQVVDQVRTYSGSVACPVGWAPAGYDSGNDAMHCKHFTTVDYDPGVSTANFIDDVRLIFNANLGGSPAGQDACNGQGNNWHAYGADSTTKIAYCYRLAQISYAPGPTAYRGPDQLKILGPAPNNSGYCALVLGGEWESYGFAFSNQWCAHFSQVRLGLNTQPVADARVTAGSVQTFPSAGTKTLSVDEGLTANLWGQGSSDAETPAANLTYNWSCTGGVLSFASSNNPSWTSPQVTGDVPHICTLTVRDPAGLQSTDTVAITVKDIPVVAVNHPPVANAGSAQTVNEGVVVTLDGSGSSDPDGDTISYAWTQTAGPSASLTGVSAQKPTFTAPRGVSAATVFTFSLIVTDNRAVSSAPSTVNITVNNTVGSPGSPPNFDYSIANSGNITIQQNSSGNVTVTATWISGSGDVDLSVSGQPSGVNTGFGPSSQCRNFSGGSCARTLYLNIGGAVPVGVYPVTVTGVSPSKTTTFNLTITAAPITANPPKNVHFSFAPNPVSAGATSQIDWVADNAVACFITDDNIDFADIGQVCNSSANCNLHASAVIGRLTLPITAPARNTRFTLACVSSDGSGASGDRGILIKPGNFSQASPVNVCTADAAPVTLSWGVSPATEKYHIFRVIDDNNDGVMQQSEVDAAGAGSNLNPGTVADPSGGLAPANVCTGNTCSWTDDTAAKNTRYLYIIRARNSQGVTFSNTAIEPQSVTDLRAKTHTTVCPARATLTPSTQTIDRSQTATLSWTSADASICSINQGMGNICPSSGTGTKSAAQSCDTGGTVIVAPSISTAYILTCNGAVGTPPAAVSAQVNIRNQAPQAVVGMGVGSAAASRVYTNNLRVRQNELVTLFFAPFFGGTLSQFSSLPANQKSFDPDQSFDPAQGILNGGKCEWNSALRSALDPITGAFDFDGAVKTGDTKILAASFPADCIISRTHTFADTGGTYKLLRISDIPGAQAGIAEVTITAVPAPVITSFTATPNPINQDQAFVLAWASNGTTSCSSPDAGFNTAIAGRTSGSAPISSIVTSPKDYVLNCASADSDLYPTPATAIVTVRINQCVAALTPSSTSVPIPGDAITLSWSATNARTCSISGITPAPICSTDAMCRAGGTTGNIAITAARTFTLSCSGDAGACSATTPTVSVANQAPVAVAGASTNISFPRTYANTITVTQNVATDIFLSAGPTIDTAAGSTDSDGSLTRCDWNTDFRREPPITFENNNAISPPGDIGDCDRIVASRTFTDPPTAPGKPNIYPMLRVTDNEGATADATLRVHILPNLAVSLTTNQASGDAPFSPTLTATITNYTGSKSNTGNFYFWFDCINTSPDLGVVKQACGDPTAITDAGGDRACTLSADKKMAKCETVPLQGFEFLTLTAPGYDARVQPYTPKVIVERGNAPSAEARASATANTPFAYTLAKTGGDIDVGKGSSGNTTIAFDHTGGAAQRVTFSASGQPTAVTPTFNPSFCDDDCTTTVTLATTNSTPIVGPTSIIIRGDAGGGTTASVNLTVRDLLTCGPATQSATVGIPITPLTAQGGTGTFSWTALNPTDERLPDPNASPDIGAGATFTTTYGATGSGKHIKVVSGSQTTQCTVNVAGQTLGAAISAAPDNGVQPLSSTITGAVTSGSTAAGTMNYSFWWDCANPSANVSIAVNGTGSGPNENIVCGDPPGAANLSTNYPEITCLGGAVGARCFVNPTSVANFDPINKPLKVAHTYNARGVAYKPKVIIERGSAPSAQSMYVSGVQVSFPALTVSCAVAPTSALTGANIIWTATPGGGSGTFTYAWTGDAPLQGRTGQAPVAVYTTAGNKNGTVIVTDTVTSVTRSASCGPVAISLPPNGAPVAVAGMSKDTSSTRSYTSSVDVKFGVSTPLYFSAFVGTKASPTPGQISTDSDGWTSSEGISAGGHCDWNIELRLQAPPIYPDGRITSPALPTACEASRSNPISTPYTFNDLSQNDAQISRTLTYNVLQITDNRNVVSNDGQASVVVHYQPTATLTVNGLPSVSVVSGAPVIIAWSSTHTHASSCTSSTIPGFPASNPVLGSIIVNPTASATYSVSCLGSSLWSAASASASVAVQIPFTFTLAKSNDVSVIQGATTNNTSIITATKTAGTGEAITFSASGLPASASASFAPVSCTPGAVPCTSTMTITTTSATPAGDHPLIITSTAAGGGTANVPLTLTVSSRMDVGLTAPSSAVVGTPITLTAQVSNYTGAPTDTINYKFWKNCTNPESQNLSTIITACGNPDAVFDGVSANPQSATLTYTTTGSFTPKVFVQRGAAANEDRVDNPVVVSPQFTFTIVASGNISVVQGATAGNANTITVTKTAGTGQAALLSASGLPQGAGASFSPTSCTPGTSPCTSTMTIVTARGTGATPAGTYPIIVTGTAGAVIATAPSFNLIVSSQMSVNLSALPSATGPAPSVLQLQAEAPAVDYTGEPTDTATYTFWKNCNQAGMDVAALSTTAVCGAPDYVASNVSDLSVRTTDLIYTQQGTYHGKVIARRGTAAAEDRITITVNPPFDFSLASDRPRVELVQGSIVSSANRITAAHISGTPTALTFGARVNNLPASALSPVIRFSPASCPPPSGGSCGADISISTESGLPAGDYPVVVSAGSKSITFTMGIVSHINVALAAMPLAAGPAPHTAQLRATASNYTGVSIDALNYSFWWNCNNPTDSPSAAKDACGDPMDAAVGFKMNGSMQEILTTPISHTYATEGIYFAKVIVERGGARREARIAITVGNPKVSVSCSVAPVVAVVNQPVIWTAVPALGTAPYRYAWIKDVSCGLNPAQCGSMPMQYASAGDKFGSVTVTDAEGDTAARLCDNALKVFQPTLVIVPAAAQIRADGDTLQLVAKYDPDGPAGTAAEQTVTTSASWSIPLAEQNRATVSAAGLITSKVATGNVTVSASYRDSFNNVIVAEADIAVIKRDAIVCDPARQTVRTGEQTFPMKASGGTGSYDWLVQETDATPRAGSTVGSQTFSTIFNQAGTKTVGVTSGSQSGACEVEVTGQNLSANLSVFPAFVTVPDTTRLTAVASGNALGTANYSFWWNCGSDRDADGTTRVEIAEGRCGELPTGVAVGQCAENQYGAKCSVIAAASRAIDHGYQETGTMSPKVIIERGSATPAQAKASVVVDAANVKPDAIAGISMDVNATRVYARSIVVTQNVPTRIYFAAFTGKATAIDEKSTDPNGWGNALNGVYHPNTPAASGQCTWNADLDRDAQVSFEDNLGTNRNPQTEKECVTSFVHNFQDFGTHSYAVLRITDNRGAVSEPALVTVDVVAPGAPEAMPGVSADPSADRVYREIVPVKQGENVELWVSARRRVGATDIVSSDPDGWHSKNGGVAKGGSCRWNRDLDKGVFPTGVPTYEYVLNDPQDPSEDCDTKIVNEVGTSFVRVFNDAPRAEPYSFEALRIYDNTGLRSNKGMIKVRVLPSDPPNAVASASADGGATFHGATAGDPVVVVRGVSTLIAFSAAGSTDPDGWANPVNGVSASGHCDWNSDLDQGSITFENRIASPASPAACNPAPRTYTFNDRPGIIDFAALNITDNKGFTSLSPGGVSIRVTAPDLVISDGPLPSIATALVEKESATFTGKIKNQGDAGTTATFNAEFSIDLGNNGSTDLTLSPTPTATGLAAGAEKSVVSGVWSNLPKGTHKITLCADQPTPAVVNEFFIDNNCASQVLTILPDNRSPVAEAGISSDGITYGVSITVLKGAPVQIWLSADRDINGNQVASFDPDGWTDMARGIASGGKCEWNLDLASAFSVQNTVNNPASPAICNRNRMDKTFNDPAGTYIYSILRITDAKLGQSNVANISVRVVDSLGDLNHIDCVASACTVVSGAGANVCMAPGGVCTGGSGGLSSGPLSDLIISEAPHRASGKLEEGKKATFAARVKNQGIGAITHAFDNSFLVDLGNNGTIDARLPVPSRTARAKAKVLLAALPINDLALPLPASLPELAAGADAPVESGEWRNIPIGTHRVIACADSDDGVSEADETNNCDSVIVTVPPSSSTTGPLRVDSCSASPRDVRAGVFVDWSATVSGGTGVYSFSWSGDAPLEGITANPVSIVYQATGVKSGSLIVTSGSETASRNCGSVNVTPGILSFTANPLQIHPGQSSMLSWDTTGFISCVITADQPGQSIGSVGTSDTRSVQPSQNTRYTLTCSGVSQSQSVTIIVSSQPVIDEIVP